MRVRAGSKYIYDPVPIDRYMTPFGVGCGKLRSGQIVRVVNLPGCPKANTMGHCHIQDPETGDFLGLVQCNSLRKPEDGQ